jgi:hypothetical protein
MTAASFGSTPPKPRPVDGGWIVPLGVTVEEDASGDASYTGYEVFSLTLFQHDLEAALAGADLPEGDYATDVLEARKHGIRLQRAAEYPPATDYLDAVAKGDAEQVEAYRLACLQVKADHPFPTLEEVQEALGK